jgi:hypothetical protein
MKSAVFFQEKVDNPILLLGEPARQTDHQKIESGKIHGAICPMWSS